MKAMLILLQYLAFAILVAVSLAGFIAAAAWMLAIWFEKRG